MEAGRTVTADTRDDSPRLPGSHPRRAAGAPAALLVLLALPAPLRGAAEPRSHWWNVLAEDQLGFFEGRCTVEQRTGEQPALTLRFRVALEYLVRPGKGTEGGRELLVARSVAPVPRATRTPAGAGSSALEIFLLGSAGGLERTGAGVGLPPLLEAYLPVDSVFPPLPSLLDLERRPRQKGEIRLHGEVYRELEFEVTRETRERPGGDIMILERTFELPPGGLSLGGGGNGARRILEWRESFRHRRRGDRLALEGLQRVFRLTTRQSGYTFEIRHDLTLDAREVRPLKAEEARYLASFEPELRFLLESLGEGRGAGGAFRAGVRRPAVRADLRRRAGKLARVLEESAFAPFAAALDSLAAVRPEDPAPPGPPDPPPARPAARVEVGKPAPDFVLEDLGGRQASLHELTRGKVAYVTFWGFR